MFDVLKIYINFYLVGKSKEKTSIHAIIQYKGETNGIVQKVNFEKLPPLTPPYTGGETAW